jgi:hypothetical protein
MGAGSGILSVWVQYTAPALDGLLDDIEAVAPNCRCHPSVLDDDIADVLIDVNSEAEGAEIVAALEERLRPALGVDIVRVQFLSAAR